MARASLMTRTPRRASACSKPRRSVTCSNVPAAMVRTSTASGSASAKPGMAMPGPPSPSTKAQSCSDNTVAAAPCRANASVKRRVCQSGASTRMAMRVMASAVVGEGPRQDRRIELAAAEALAALKRRDLDDARAEQHRIDLVEITLIGVESLGEWLAVVAARAARQPIGQRLRLGLR